MTYSEEVSNKLVRDIINLIIGISGFAIKANQNAPRPKNPYATVSVTSVTSTGWEESYLDNRVEDLDYDQTIEGNREILFTINTLRKGAKDNAEAIKMGFNRESVLSLLNEAGFGLGARSDVTSVTTALEKGWEERATFTVVLNTVISDQDLVRSIQSVDISGEYESRGISTPILIED